MKLLLVFAIPLLVAAQTGAIEGTAVNKLTKTPVADVRIKMTLVGDQSKYYSATTNAFGAYSFTGIPTGKYTPWVEAPSGFSSPNPFEMAIRGTRVEVTDGGTAKFDTEVTPASTVSGRVLGPDGPISGATVLALPVASAAMGSARSEKDGSFSLKLASGKVRLAVIPLSDTLAQTFYPSATSEADALVIDVPEGVDLGGHVVRVRRAEGHKLRGVVRDPAGKPAPGASLTIARPGTNFWRNTKLKSDEHGIFEFKLVPAGEWRISAKWDVELIDWQGSTTVIMPDRDYDRVEVRVDPPFSVDAHLEGGAKDRRPGVRFELVTPSGLNLFLTATEHDGRARFEAVYPGKYRPGLFGRLEGHYLKSVLLGPTDITGQAVEFGPGTPELAFVFATNGGKVHGEVEEGAGAKVALIWANRDNFIPGAEVTTVTCDERGRFSESDLRPGNWYVVAYRGQPGDLREKIFDRGMWREAASIKAVEGETATVKLTVTNF